MSEQRLTRRRWLRFSIASLLFVTLCFAGLFGGYRTGYRSGYQSGQQDHYDGNLVTETYATDKIIWPDLLAEERTDALAGLIDLIQSTIYSEVWVDPAIGAEIRDFPSNQSLVITAPGAVQREIRELFTQFVQQHDRKSAKSLQLVPAMQALASRGKSDTSDYQFTVPKSSRIAQQWYEDYYNAAIEDVCNVWGRPDFAGPCTAPDFPAWSLDQRIAIWPRGEGLAYLALRYVDDGKLHLIAGWRKALTTDN